MLGACRRLRMLSRVANFCGVPNPSLDLPLSKRLFRQNAAATDAKRRPGFQTSTLQACAPQGTDMSEIGQPRTRVDGRLKVTGAAMYAAEFQRSKLAYGALIQSSI